MGLCRDLDQPHEVALSVKGRKLWACDAPSCGVRRVPWNSKWQWFGSYRDLDDDPFSIFAVCSEPCKAEFDAAMNPEKPEPRSE